MRTLLARAFRKAAAIVGPPSSQIDVTDSYVTWLCFANAGMLDRGNLYLVTLSAACPATPRSSKFALSVASPPICLLITRESTGSATSLLQNRRRPRARRRVTSAFLRLQELGLAQHSRFQR